MTKQEQIEEIFVTIQNCDQVCINCEVTECGICAKRVIADANAIYDAGYRKVPDGAVVLTPEERDDEMKATNEILAERDKLKKKIERLQNDYNYNQTLLDNAWKLLKSQDRLRSKQRIDIVKEIKDYINDKIVEDFGDGADSITYYTLDIDEFFNKLDDLVKGN